MYRISWLGSPPRMRGKVVQLLRPDHAPWDHPRACGEKLLPRVVNDFTEGSPPRMRGKGSLTLDPSPGLGITPAHAGKRLTTWTGYAAPEDHPRACGEKRLRALPAHNVSGSPPRMRGKEHHFAGWGPGAGITPAHAGKSRNVLDNAYRL